MNNKIIDTFLEKTYSMQQAKRRLLILKRKLLKQFFKTEIEDPAPDTEDTNWLDSLGAEFFEQFNNINVYQKIIELEQDLKKNLVLTIYIGFEMPEDEINKLGNWLRNNFKTKMLFETRIDPNVIAGAALSWRGIYKDFSVRQKIDQDQKEILASFKNFLH